MQRINSLFSFVLSSLLALGILMGSSLPSYAASAASTARAAVAITFTTPTSLSMNKPFIVTGFIKTGGGNPVANKNVRVYLDGNFLGVELTKTDGSFQRRFKGQDAGSYKVSATTEVDHYYEAGSGTTSVDILPVDVKVQVVPAISGIAFEMAGQKVLSGADGVADFKIGSAGKYQLSALVDEYSNPDQRIEFSRWLDDTAKPYLLVQVPSSKPIQFGVNVYQKVSQSFVDLTGYPVSTERIQQYTIRSAQGDQFTLTDGQARFLPASRVVRYRNGLSATNLLYSVTSLTVDGANVVNKSQQQYYVHPNDTWQISLILYSLSVRANDGLFGRTVGKSINLIYPDGHGVIYPFDQKGTVVIHGLARGNYNVQVLDTKGLRQTIPVALSHSQTVDIRVPTGLDLFFVISIGLLSALGLILYGRRKQFFSAVKRRSQPSPHPQAQNALVKTEKYQPLEKLERQDRNEIIKWS